MTAGHDVSDGGLVTCLLEMAFAGNCGMCVDIVTSDQASGDAGCSAGQSTTWLKCRGVPV